MEHSGSIRRLLRIYGTDCETAESWMAYLEAFAHFPDSPPQKPIRRGNRIVVNGGVVFLDGIRHKLGGRFVGQGIIIRICSIRALIRGR